MSPHLFRSCSATSECKILEPKARVEFKVCFSNKTLLSDIDLRGDLRALLFSCPSCQGKGPLHSYLEEGLGAGAGPCSAQLGDITVEIAL